MVQTLRARSLIELDVMEQAGPRLHNCAEFKGRACGVASVQGRPLVGDLNASGGESRSRKVCIQEIQILVSTHPQADALALRVAQFENEAVVASFLKPPQPNRFPVFVADNKAQQVHVEGPRRREISNAVYDMARASDVESRFVDGGRQLYGHDGPFDN